MKSNIHNVINADIGDVELLENLVLYTNLLIYQRASVVKMLPMFIDFKASIDRMEKNGVITETSVNKLGVLKHRISIMV